jgi:hypothetical protein
MKHLPSVLLIGALALALRAEAPQTKPTETPAPKPADTPAAKTSSDPFVKDPAGNGDVANDPDSAANCQIIYETYVLDKSDAQVILEAERSGAARYRRVLDLVQEGRARLENLMGYTGRSGQRSIVEAVDELLYPTEFAPPANAKGTPFPTAWEMRNVGDTLEVEPVILADGRTCDLNFVPQRVSFVGFRDEPGSPDTLAISQPIFDTQKITTSVTVLDGQPAFLGTFSRATSQGVANGGGPSEVTLAFLNVSVVSIPIGKVPAKPVNAGPVELTYSVFSLERAAAREMLVAPASFQTSWDKLQTLLAQKKARLEHVSTIKTKSGQRAVTEEIRENRFATEFNAPGGLHKTDDTKRTTTAEVSGKPGALGKTITEETTTVTHSTPDDPQVPGYATAFETHNVGLTVEVEPVVGPDGVTIDLNENVQSTTDRGVVRVNGVGANYPQKPLLEAANITTSQTIPAGGHVFVGTMNPPGANGVNDRQDSGHTWVLFVHATVGDR